MANKPLLLLILLLRIVFIHAQEQPWYESLTFITGYNGPHEVPFWMRSNQFGSVPPSGLSASFIGSIHKDYNSTIPKKFDWAVGTEFRLNAGKRSAYSTVGDPYWINLIEGYGKIRYGIFELKAGRFKDITGLCDTLLSSGSWAVSGNAPGVPKIEICIPEFVYIPFFDRLFAIKFGYVNGIMGNWYITNEKIANTPTFLMQHTFYGRIGKPDWRLNIYGGFNHQTVWGNEKEILGEDYKLSPFETFLYASIAKPYSNGDIENMRVGNHLGSIDIGATYDFNSIRVFLYRQFLYDAGALYYLANLRDGLNGLSLLNRKAPSGNIQWKKVVFEFLYTRNQAGEVWSPHTASIYENYYNNGYYPIGWSYKGIGLGNPFITPRTDMIEELPEEPDYSFTNNRVVLFHAGVDMDIYGWNIISKLSYSQNHGTYATSKSGKIWEGQNTEAPFGIFPETEQFSGYLCAAKDLNNNITIGLTLALDKGGLFENGFGVLGSIGIKI